MFFIPFPFLIAELIIFIWAVQEWGFFTTLGYYLLPCLLGFVMLSMIGRRALMILQTTVIQGSLPGNKILNSGALFLSGLLFSIPSFFSRVLAVLLLLPGTRHLLIWRFKLAMVQKMAKGSANFFNFGMGGTGFKYYQYTGGRPAPGTAAEGSEERDVTGTQAVLDVKPIAVSHKNDDEIK